MAPRSIKDFARKIVQAFNVSTSSIDVKARNLSGGNQQKVIVGRELAGSRTCSSPTSPPGASTWGVPNTSNPS